MEVQLKPATQQSAIDVDFVDPQEMVDEQEAAAIIGVQPQTMAAWRSHNRGPTYYKVGRYVRYRPHDLGRYVAAGKVTPSAAK
jgi:hypothetical protein